MPVERLTRDAQLGAQLGDLGFGFAHSRLGKPQFGGRHLERATAMSAARTCRFQTGAGALDDQLALKLGEAGKNRKDQPTVGGGGVDRRAFAGQHLEADATLGQVADCVNEVAQVATEAVELPYDQRVITAQCLQAGIQL